MRRRTLPAALHCPPEAAASAECVAAGRDRRTPVAHATGLRAE